MSTYQPKTYRKTYRTNTTYAKRTPVRRAAGVVRYQPLYKTVSVPRVRYVPKPIRISPRPASMVPARPRVGTKRDKARRDPNTNSIGGDIGSSLGRMLGHGAQSLFKMVTGFGDYDIENNSLLEGGMSPPEIVNSVQNNGVIIRHREYIKDIFASEAFELASFDLNPGITTTFPWLSGVASAYEQYSFRGLIFEIKSLSSDAVLSTAASSALGSVMMATSYNVLDPNFATKSQMLNYEFANSAKPSLDFIHPVECAPHLTSVDTMYIRTGSLPPEADQRLYDLGNFQVATVGMQASTGIVGELWATYEIFLTKPKFGNIGKATQDVFQLNGSWTTQPLGTTQVKNSASNIGGFITGGNVYNFPVALSSGRYIVTYWVDGSTPAAIIIPAFNIQNGTVLQASQSPNNGISTDNFMVQKIVNITQQYATITLSGGTFPSVSVLGYLHVSPYIASTLTSPEEDDDPVPSVEVPSITNKSSHAYEEFESIEDLPNLPPKQSKNKQEDLDGSEIVQVKRSLLRSLY